MKNFEPTRNTGSIKPKKETRDIRSPEDEAPVLMLNDAEIFGDTTDTAAAPATGTVHDNSQGQFWRTKVANDLRRVATATDLARLIFKDGSGTVTVFGSDDQDRDQDLTSEFDADTSLVMEKDGLIFGKVVASPGTFSLINDNDTLNVELQFEPVPSDQLPDERIDIPLGWDIVVPEPDVFFNDAHVLGNETPAYIKLLSQDATLTLGSMYGAKDRRNSQDGEWKSVTLSWSQWINGQDGKNAWGFSRHPVGKNKAGASVVLGSTIDGARKAKAVDEMFALGLDIDSGKKLDQVVETILEKNLFCLIYTSHSHGKSGLELKRDDVMRKLSISSDPSVGQIQEYLRLHSKSRYDAEFIAGVVIDDPKKQTTEGVKIILKTPPLDKFRLIFPFETPVKLIDLAETQAESLSVWENAITGMAWKMLGIHFDTSCTDPSRLFYTARHGVDSEWDCMILQGDPLKFEDVPAYSKSSYAKHREGGG